MLECQLDEIRIVDFYLLIDKFHVGPIFFASVSILTEVIKFFLTKNAYLSIFPVDSKELRMYGALQEKFFNPFFL